MENTQAHIKKRKRETGSNLIVFFGNGGGWW